MLGYIVKRLLLFIPTLFIISVVAFFLSKNAPGDPVERFFEDSFSEKSYVLQAKALHLDKPLFYWSVLPRVLPDTFHTILRPYKREVVKSLALQTGDYKNALNYYEALESSIQQFELAYSQAKSDTLLSNINILKGLIAEEHLKTISQKTAGLLFIGQDEADQSLRTFNAALQDLESTDKSKPSPPNMGLAKLIWNGVDNQYHIWITNFLKGNFGYSLVSGKETSDRITSALFWTMIINISAIMLAFVLAIPIGVYAARHNHLQKGRTVTLITYFLYSLPVFWVATMLIVFFTTPEYGMDWFAGIGLGQEAGHSSIVQLVIDRTTHLILPVICLVYPSLAFISRQLSGAMQEELKKDYILTARAKGLDESKVIWKHAFRNSLFPLVTLIGSILPATIAGSVVIEVIFNIPGMGKLLVDSIFLQDWPIVFIILLLGATLTMTGILLADLLYAKLDPRVRLK
ncbi:MAG: ABC transporter permease [Saprospiraceae bacterium]|nr:ABC transporter permease [Saprospiraceae bacterium]